MAKILIYCNKFSEDDDLLGFFPGWVYGLLEHFEKITVLTPYVGRFEDRGKLNVIKLEKRNSKLARILEFYYQLIANRREFASIFILMAPSWLIISAPMAMILGKKTVMWYAVWKKTLRLKIASLLADKLVASVSESFPIETSKLVTVGQGINIDKFQPDHELRRRNSILFLGRLSPIKKVDVLIKEFSKTKDMDLTIAGGPANWGDIQYFDELKNIVRENKLSDRVKFTGKVSHQNTPSFYNSADFFVNLTPTGSFDKAMLEAMASGCIVLTVNDAMRRYLSPELQKLLIIQPEEIAARLNQLALMTDKEKQRIRGELRRVVTENHSQKQMIPRLAGVIEPEQGSIMISGFSYAYPYYFKVFEYFKNKENLFFVLPKIWIARQGKIVLKLEPKTDFNIIGAKAISYGSQSLFWKLGGLLKGFMPSVLFYIPYLRFKKNVKVYYHISEPHLLTTFLNAIAAKLFGLKYVCFTWQNLEPEARISGLKLKLSNLFTWINLSLSDAIMCGSLMSIDVIKKIKPSMKTVQIQMAGVDTERFKPSSAEKDPEKQTVLFFGALDERKGIDVLIKAFNKIKDDFPKAKLVIIGSGFVEEKLRKLAEDLKLGDRIEWRSWMRNEELPKFVAQADVFVYLSRRAGGWVEQYGYAIMQASAAGLPVVSTNNGSIYEVVVDGKSGILVETNDVGQTAGAMARILANAELARRMGEFGHKFINENFSNTVVANKMEDFLNSLCI